MSTLHDKPTEWVTDVERRMMALVDELLDPERTAPEIRNRSVHAAIALVQHLTRRYGGGTEDSVERAPPRDEEGRPMTVEMAKARLRVIAGQGGGT